MNSFFRYMTQPYSFYIAAGYDRKKEAASLCNKISNFVTNWECCASWIFVDDLVANEPPLAMAAKTDFVDIQHADAMVVLNGSSTTNAMWVELGMAIQRKIPVIILDCDITEKFLPLFQFMPNVIAVPEGEWDAKNVVCWLKHQEKRM